MFVAAIKGLNGRTVTLRSFGIEQTLFKSLVGLI